MAPENGLAVQLDLLMAGMTDEKCLGDAKKDQLGRRSIHEVTLSVPMSSLERDTGGLWGSKGIHCEGVLTRRIAHGAG